VSEQLALLPEYLTAHLQLALVALAAAALASIPLGVAVTRRRALEGPVLGLASVVQTIPSLALLAVMVPALAALGALTSARLGIELSSIGYLPAILALTLYGLLPILRNTVSGIEGVDPALREAAAGLGMTGRQQLLRVELPLALPVIVAGATFEPKREITNSEYEQIWDTRSGRIMLAGALYRRMVCGE